MLSQQVNPGEIRGPLAALNAQEDEPRDEIHVRGQTCCIVGSSAGLLYEGGQGEGRESVEEDQYTSTRPHFGT